MHFSTGNGQSRERALRQLYRHTFVSYTLEIFILTSPVAYGRPESVLT